MYKTVKNFSLLNHYVSAMKSPHIMNHVHMDFMSNVTQAAASTGVEVTRYIATYCIYTLPGPTVLGSHHNTRCLTKTHWNVCDFILVFSDDFCCTCDMNSTDKCLFKSVIE